MSRNLFEIANIGGKYTKLDLQIDFLNYLKKSNETGLEVYKILKNEEQKLYKDGSAGGKFSMGDVREISRLNFLKKEGDKFLSDVKSVYESIKREVGLKIESFESDDILYFSEQIKNGKKIDEEKFLENLKELEKKLIYKILDDEKELLESLIHKESNPKIIYECKRSLELIRKVRELYGKQISPNVEKSVSSTQTSTCNVLLDEDYYDAKMQETYPQFKK